MKIKVNYANTENKEDFEEDFILIMKLLREFGEMSFTSGHNLAQFTLYTFRRREEVIEALKELRLNGDVRINLAEEEDVDEQFL